MSHELCRAVAHDLNNLFTCVLVYAQLVEAGAEDATRACQGIVSATTRAREITEMMLVPSLELLPAEIPVGQVLAERAEELRNLACLGATLDVDVLAPEARVRGLRRDFEHVLFNLTLNAFTATADLERGSVKITLRETESGRVCLEVADNGRGISDSDVERVLEPGFTTKAGGGGLGLAFAKEAVARMEGSIGFESSSSGTLVRVDLPLVDLARPA